MFLLTTNFVKNSNIYARILFIVLKTVLDHIRNDFNTKFSGQTIMSRIFEINFSLDVTEYTTGKV